MSHAMMLYLIHNNGTLPHMDMFPFNEIQKVERFVVDFFVTLLQIYWSLFIKMAAIAAEKYTIVFGENHYHAIFTAVILLYTAIWLTNWYHKPDYHVSELVDRFFYLKQKLKCHENDISVLFDALEIRDKKIKTMEAKVRKLERELKKYD
jgi:hypothetical protein